MNLLLNEKKRKILETMQVPTTVFVHWIVKM